MKNLINIAKEKLKQNIDLELVRVIESSGGAPRTSDAYMFVDNNAKSFGTIGGGRVEYIATIDAKDFLEKKEDGNKSYVLTQEAAENLGMVCGGNMSVSFNYLTNDEKSFKILDELEIITKNQSTVYLFGAGHVSMELSHILDYIGFETVVWDEREEFANKNRFDVSKEVICDRFTNINNKIKFKKDDFVVIMTRGHVSDYTCLKEVIKSEANYIGMIGSKEKNNFIKEKILSDGFTLDDMKKVKAPIGISVGAETPEEIAVSIACEIILYKSKLDNRRKYVNKKTLFDTCKDYI